MTAAPEKPEPQRAGSWHESLATVLVVALATIILTSPCWGLALIWAVAK